MRPTCTLRPADQRGSRRSGAPIAGPGEQDTDVVLCVRLQVPNLVGEWAHTMSLCPRRLAGSVLDFPTNDWSISHDGVGVELDDQIRGARPQELWGCNRSRGHCKREGHIVVGELIESDSCHLCSTESYHPVSTTNRIHESIFVFTIEQRKLKPNHCILLFNIPTFFKLDI